MSEENSNTTAPAAAPEAAPSPPVSKEDAPTGAAELTQDEAGPVKSETSASATAPATEDSDKTPKALIEKTTQSSVEKSDVEMEDAAAPVEAPAADADETTASALVDATGPTPSKSKAKRKSIGGGGDAKSKKLNKKASKARILHLDAQPGDHYFVKLKGFPQWPVIICDDDMLPQSLIKSRPVTAKRADGTYRDDYADGAKKAADRTFPVMYLHTNEFGWVPNSDLIDLDPNTVRDIKMDKMRKDLVAAHELAAQHHPLSYYKDVLHQFQEELMEQQEQAKAAKAAKTKKPKAAVDDDGDVEMDDAVEEGSASPKDKKAKKRKAEDTAETPQRSDSVKKPKIKLTTNSTPKTNGAQSTPKAAPKAAAEGKTQKPKNKKVKDTEEKKYEKEPITPKEPKISAEEKHQRKEKEVLFLRHKLQKGLLTRDQEPKEEEMKLMSDYIGALEKLPDLEVSIIRATKINKVLKAILKLDNIPKEEEFRLKQRSQELLEIWNKLLTTDGAPAAPSEGANGVNGTKEAAKANGVKEKSEEKTEEAPKEAAQEEPKEAPKAEDTPAPSEKAAEETKAPEPVEASV